MPRPLFSFVISGNPILSRKDWPYPINSVFNAGAVKLADGDTLLLCRVEDRRGLSHLCAARSTNGIDGWRIDAEPTLMASPRDFPEEIWGIEDPRITYVPGAAAICDRLYLLRPRRSWSVARTNKGFQDLRDDTASSCRQKIRMLPCYRERSAVAGRSSTGQ